MSWKDRSKRGSALFMALLVAFATATAAQTPTRSVPDRPSDRGTSGGFGRGMDGGGSDRGAGAGTAGWQMCNLSGQALVQAVALWPEGTGWRSTGWIPLARGKCATMPTIPVSTAYYFAVGKGQSWSGRNAFCLNPGNASGRAGTSCSGAEKPVGFRKATLRGSLVSTNFR
ncbi:DUF1036 domain-containing protein [Paracoccus marinaquae]|uniref:DUF1036 domain-containing protein n=1 Tax=Paracoccus marinaquae TaxID=2841926 RepID=A0ABS6AHG2_9RHOB|nr:DUF1036 domain-containing protein [Paracoccus marinaquae]MBU3029362.1 DUF1036 domain-containing protein [Paracoccus marinaquae]